MQTTVGARPVAVVHDYLTQRGGAERVVLALLDTFPGAELHTALYKPEDTYPEFGAHAVRTSPINRIGVFRNRYRSSLPVLAPAVSAMKIDAEVSVCSSSGWSHGVRTTGKKVVYCHNPARWLYQAKEYLGIEGHAARASAHTVLAGIAPVLRRWDKRAAGDADRYVVNSTTVRDRVRAAYGIDAEVVHPPVMLDPQGAIDPYPGIDGGFVLCVGRLLPYKNVDAVCAAASRIDERVVVVGTGPLIDDLRVSAPSNVVLVGQVSDAQLRWLYSQSRCLVAAAYEDFGLTPLEAASFGVASATLRRGGFLDSVVEGETGVFFDDLRPDSIADAVDKLLADPPSATTMTDHAEEFSLQRFSERMRGVVDETARG